MHSALSLTCIHTSNNLSTDKENLSKVFMTKQFYVTMLLHVFFGLVVTLSEIPSIVEMTAGNSHMLPHEQVLHLPRESCTFVLVTFLMRWQHVVQHWVCTCELLFPAISPLIGTIHKQ